MDDSSPAETINSLIKALHNYLDAELRYLEDVEQELTEMMPSMSDKSQLLQRQEKLQSLERRAEKHSRMRTAVQRAVRSNLEQELMLSDAIKTLEENSLSEKYQQVQQQISQTAMIKRSVDRSLFAAERIVREVLEAFGIQQPSATYEINGAPSLQSFQSQIDMRS